MSGYDGERQNPHTLRMIRPKSESLLMSFMPRGEPIYGPAVGNGNRPKGFHMPLLLKMTLGHNALFFRDSRERDYSLGISRSVSSMKELVKWQVAQRNAHFPHVQRTFCLGTSSGARAAIASGYYLRVPIVWAFAPPDRGRVPPSVSAQDPPWMDLYRLLFNGNGVTEYRIYYNAGCVPDRRYAEGLKDCPGVRLFPQPGHHHCVIHTLARLGKLNGILDTGI